MFVPFNSINRINRSDGSVLSLIFIRLIRPLEDDDESGYDGQQKDYKSIVLARRQVFQVSDIKDQDHQYKCDPIHQGFHETTSLSLLKW